MDSTNSVLFSSNPNEKSRTVNTNTKMLGQEPQNCEDKYFKTSPSDFFFPYGSFSC